MINQITRLILQHTFITVNSRSATKSQKKHALRRFHRYLAKKSPSYLEEILFFIRENWDTFSVAQKRVTKVFLGQNWRQRKDERIVRHFMMMLDTPVKARRILRMRFDAKREAANKFLERKKIFSPVLKGVPVSLKEILKIEDVLELGTRYWERAIKVIEAAIRMEFKGRPAYLLTITAPAFLHVPESAEQIRAAANYIQNAWARLRANFSKHGYGLIGARVTELHKDDTPHYHCLITTDAPWEEIQRMCAMAFIPIDSAQELGATKHRFDLKPLIDSAGHEGGIRRVLRYVTKYLFKGVARQAMGKKDKETRYIFSAARIRVMSMFGFRGVTRILRLAYRYGITGIDFTRAVNFDVEVLKYNTHYEFWIWEDDYRDCLVRAWSVPRWWDSDAWMLQQALDRLCYD